MSANQLCFLSVVVPTPAHSPLADQLTYASPTPLAAGTLVRVPLGARDLMGIVWSCHTQPPVDLLPAQIKSIASALTALPPLPDEWRQLVSFAARYYQRSIGEVALSALPPALRDLQPVQLDRRLRKLAGLDTPPHVEQQPPVLSDEQRGAVQAIAGSTQPILLFGATGSGKTEVYLHATHQQLGQDERAQVLILVPEINLTPQLEQRFISRFGAGRVVSLHSGLTPAQRLKNWLSAHLGHAQVVLGTRLAVLASMPHLKLVVVDEEHDPSYKGQDGARLSARDLAIYRAHKAGCAVVLGSATPSLESWHAAQQGRYQLVNMPSRMGLGQLPALKLVDMARQPKGCVLPAELVDAMIERSQRSEQSLLLLNRRGYAPVLSCHACGWKSQCPHCSAFRVFHKINRTLRCHHCGVADRVPPACPDCGQLDIQPVGKGTEQLEEQVAALLAQQKRPCGQALRVLRIDADSTRPQGSLQTQLAQMHSGEVDVLVGTQMVAKGHDFRRITLVAVLNADSALFAGDYRAPERLFALLMQAGGRAGRDAALSHDAQLWVPTWNPTHPLFLALKKHDFATFANAQLQERLAASMPPFSYQALLRADARTQAAAQAFLSAAQQALQVLDPMVSVFAYPPAPMPMQRLANVERAHMLLESPSRSTLQRLLTLWQPHLRQCAKTTQAKGLLRWAIDVDPLSI